MLITVFTPAYNRAGLLPRLYDSLCHQSYKDFEWLIVDDGSVDNTEDVVNAFTKKPGVDFIIRYVKKENGGKHTAINLGVKEAAGELFFIVDSDDSLPSNSLELISSAYLSVREKDSLGGICGYMAHHNDEMIGRFVNHEPIETNTRELKYKYNVNWDMAEVLKTSVLRKYPFPEIEGERFCPEALVLFRVARDYNFWLIPKVVYYRDYLDGGLTDNIIRIRMKSPKASTLFYAEHIRENIPYWAKIKAAINYWRFWMCAKSKQNVSKVSWICKVAFIAGWMLHIRDLRTIKR